MSGLKKSQHLSLPFKDIKVATNNFETCIGKGGYGRVYKGKLFISGKFTTVAVKRLNVQFGQGLKEFLTEIELLTGQEHPNLISLLGYCDEGNEKIIVYEYAERSSLDQYIKHSDNAAYTLTWHQRLKVCIDVARGLNHLHSHVGKHQTIIHRDIKSANILLDENWVAKISDLGLSKLGLAGLDRSAIISRACGTPGYCEPEYIISGIVTKKSDVYSFGMVLFEVLCGKLCTVIDKDGFLLSAKSVKEYYKNKKIHEIIDPSLREQMSSIAMSIFLAIAYRCLHDDREKRPPMDVVIKELEETMKIQANNSMSDESSSRSLERNTLLTQVNEEEHYLEDTLAAYRRPADAAARIQAGFKRALQIRTKKVEFSKARCIIAAMRIQHAFRNHEIRKQMAASVRIQYGFHTWKIRKDFLNKRRQAIKIQAVFRGHLVRRQMMKLCLKMRRFLRFKR